MQMVPYKGYSDAPGCRFWESCETTTKSLVPYKRARQRIFDAKPFWHWRYIGKLYWPGVYAEVSCHLHKSIRYPDHWVEVMRKSC